MSIDKKPLSRRDFIKTTGKIAGGLAGLTVLSKCKTNEVFTPPGAPMSISIYNTSDIYGSPLSTRVLFKDEVRINLAVSDIASKDVDPSRIAAKDENGAHINYSNTGDITLNYVEGRHCDVYVFDNTPTGKGNVIDYASFEGCSRQIGKDPTWHREDEGSYIGDDAVIRGAMNTFNSLLRFGSFNEVDSGGTRGVGYGYCGPYDAGCRSHTWFGCNPNFTSDPTTCLLVLAGRVYAAIYEKSILRAGNLDHELFKKVLTFACLKSG